MNKWVMWMIGGLVVANILTSAALMYGLPAAIVAAQTISVEAQSQSEATISVEAQSQSEETEGDNDGDNDDEDEESDDDDGITVYDRARVRVIIQKDWDFWDAQNVRICWKEGIVLFDIVDFSDGEVYTYTKIISIGNVIITLPGVRIEKPQET